MDPFANVIRRQWVGDEPLWKAFWVYGMMVGTLVESVLFLGLEQTYQETDEDILGPAWLFLLADGYALLLSLVFIVAYGTWNFVSVWRCARNTTKALWRWSARAFYVIGIGLFLGTLIFALLAGFTTAFDMDHRIKSSSVPNNVIFFKLLKRNDQISFSVE